MIVEHLVIAGYVAAIPVTMWWINRASARDLVRFTRRRVVEAGTHRSPPTRPAPTVDPHPVGASSRAGSASPSLPARPRTPTDAAVPRHRGIRWAQGVHSGSR